MRSARELYRLNLGLAGLGGLAVVLAGAVAFRAIALGSVPTARLLRDCRRFLLPHVTLGSAMVLALAVLATAATAFAIRSAARQLRGYRRFLRAIEVVGERRFGDVALQLIAGAEPEAFCAGFLRPRIYLSAVSVEVLTRAELEAVAAHEAHHARRRDPLRILLLGTLADALFFLPAIRRLKQRYEQLAEIAADEAAVTATGDPSPLAAALLRFGERGAPGIVGIAPERVDHLLGSAPPSRLPAAAIAGGLATVVAVVAAAAAAHGMVGGRVGLAPLAAQSCMLAMVLLPLIALAALAVLGRRTIVARGR